MKLKADLSFERNFIIHYKISNFLKEILKFKICIIFYYLFLIWIRNLLVQSERTVWIEIVLKHLFIKVMYVAKIELLKRTENIILL
jgi:hypothetical protein